MPKWTAQQLLRDAAEKIDYALTLLDMKSETCASCSHTKHTNQTHFNVSRQFMETPRSLKTAADKLDHADNVNRAAEALLKETR